MAALYSNVTKLENVQCVFPKQHLHPGSKNVFNVTVNTGLVNLLGYCPLPLERKLRHSQALAVS